MAIELDLDVSALQRVGMDQADALVTRVTRRTLNRSSVKAPVDSGNLRATGSISGPTRQGNVMVGAVEYTADYAAAVHNGRRALTIRPRGGGLLRFEVGGRVVYARSVRQPARPARPYLSSALEEVARPEGFEVTVSVG